MFPWLDSDKEVVDRGIQNLHVCFYMRRTAWVRYAFAAAVGKRHYTERLNSTNKTAIIEHHRSVQWSEKEYMQLLALVQDSRSKIQNELIRKFSAGGKDPIFLDYTNSLGVHRSQFSA